jgi:UDP-N-acetylglucosamine 2-epimerase
MKKNIQNSVDITVKSHLETKQNKIPMAYSESNVSSKIVKIIQGYTQKINKEIWKK